MKMSRALIALALVVLGACISYGQKAKPYSQADEYVYEGRLRRVRGKVTILNHPTLGKTPAGGEQLIFQRDGCKDCLVGTNADADGNYDILLGVGKYRLIAQYKNCGVVAVEDCAGYNLLAADQEEYVVVHSGYPYGVIEFNVSLVLPKN
jgi:hypothetical protein